MPFYKLRPQNSCVTSLAKGPMDQLIGVNPAPRPRIIDYLTSVSALPSSLLLHQTTIQQYVACDGTVGGPVPFQISYCLNTASNKTITITEYSNTVSNVFDFRRGNTFYLACKSLTCVEVSWRCGVIHQL